MILLERKRLVILKKVWGLKIDFYERIDDVSKGTEVFYFFLFYYGDEVIY